MSSDVLDIKLQAAINEIVDAARSSLCYDVINGWLTEYKDLFDALMADTGKRPTVEIVHGRTKAEFERVYMHLSELSDYFQYEKVCETAMNEYHAILQANARVHDNLRLVQWVRKYEKLGLEDLLEPPLEGEYVHNVRTIYDVSYVAPGCEFQKSMEFYKVFSRLFFEEEILPDSLAKFRNPTGSV